MDMFFSYKLSASHLKVNAKHVQNSLPSSRGLSDGKERRYQGVPQCTLHVREHGKKSLQWLNQVCCPSVCNPIFAANIRDQVAAWQSKIITIYSLNWDAKEGQCVLASNSPAWPKKQQRSLVHMFVLLLLLSRILPHRFQSFEGQKGPLYHAVTSPGWGCPGNRWLKCKQSSSGEKISAL